MYATITTYIPTRDSNHFLRHNFFAEFYLQEKERQSQKDEKIRQLAMAQKQKMVQKNEQRLRLRA